MSFEVFWPLQNIIWKNISNETYSDFHTYMKQAKNTSGTFSAQVTMVSFLDSWTFPLFLPVPILSFKSNLVQLFIQFYLQGEPAAVDAPLWDTVENIFFNGQEVPYKGWMLMNYLKQNNQGTLQYELFFICLHAFVALARQLYGLRKC